MRCYKQLGDLGGVQITPRYNVMMRNIYLDCSSFRIFKCQNVLEFNWTLLIFPRSEKVTAFRELRDSPDLEPNRRSWNLLIEALVNAGRPEGDRMPAWNKFDLKLIKGRFRLEPSQENFKPSDARTALCNRKHYFQNLKLNQKK